jgi:hypothetical protein
LFHPARTVTADDSAETIPDLSLISKLISRGQDARATFNVISQFGKLD